jgi:VanZ family protein
VKARALAWLPALAWAAVIFYLSHQPTLPAPELPNVDKVAHFGAYAVLGVCLAYAVHASSLPPMLSFVLGAAYGASDEFHQMFVPGRSPELLDWVADAAGVAAATYLFSRWRMRRGAPAGASAAPAPSPGA